MVCPAPPKGWVVSMLFSQRMEARGSCSKLTFLNFCFVTISQDLTVAQCDEQRPRRRNGEAPERQRPRTEQVEDGAYQQRSENGTRCPRSAKDAERQARVAFAQRSVGRSIDHR